MATSSDLILSRLRSLLPGGWFSDTAPLRDAVLGGLADGLAAAFDFLQTVKAGTRRVTTTGWLLDLDAYGFFGPYYLRRQHETDDSWRSRYLPEIFRKRVTRPSIIQALTDLTGRVPKLYEPWNPGDAGAYGIGTLAYGGGRPTAPSILGYDIAGGGYGRGGLAYLRPQPIGGSFKGAGFYGSLSYPKQIFIVAYRPQPIGIPNILGYGIGIGGYGGGTIAYANQGQLASGVTDADIYACVARNVAAGITAWVTIRG